MTFDSPAWCVWTWKFPFVSPGIPVEEEEEEQDTSIKGRLLALLYKIKGPPQKTEEEPTEKEQAVPSKSLLLRDHARKKEVI